jgi:hypothetical protein
MIGAVTTPAHRQPEVSAVPGPIRRALTLMSQLCCRHSYIRRAGEGRLRLECTDCGYTTPGIAANRASRASAVNAHSASVNSPVGRLH